MKQAFLAIAGLVAAMGFSADLGLFKTTDDMFVSEGAFADNRQPLQLARTESGVLFSVDTRRQKAPCERYVIHFRKMMSVAAGTTLKLTLRFGSCCGILNGVAGLRVRDASGETFHYFPSERTRAVDGTTELLYEISDDKATFRWGGDGNGKFGNDTVRLSDVTFSIDEGASETDRVEILKLESCERPKWSREVSAAVDTGNPMHLVRNALESPVLVISSNSEAPRRWHGTLSVRDFFGRGRPLPVDVMVPAKGRLRVPVPQPERFGHYRIEGVLASGDDSACVNAAFAVLPNRKSTAKAPLGRFRMGVNFHSYWGYDEEDRKIAEDALVALGAKLVRGSVGNFRQIQPRRGEWRWEKTDRIVDELESRGIAVHAIVYSPPAWAIPEATRQRVKGLDGASDAPPDLDAYAEYLKSFARRYGRRIDYYEIGNEWDNLFHSGVLKADEAVALQKTAYRAVKSACPEACVIHNGWGTVNFYGDTVREVAVERFMTEARGFYDRHVIHIHGSFGRYERQLDDIFFPDRVRLGLDGKVPWYSDETAMSSGNAQEEYVAATVWKKILHAQSMGSVDYIWYNLRAIGPNANELGYGLMDRDFTPRPSFAAFSALESLIAGLEAEKPFERTGYRRIYRLKGNKDGASRVVYAGWDSAAEPKPLRLKIDSGVAEVMDLMGNVEPVTAKDGIVEWRPGRFPSALIVKNATRCVPLKEDGDAVFSPAYFWMWNGRLVAKELCSQLEDMHAHGLRNVCIHPFPKGFRDWFPTEMEPDYLTDCYLDVFAKVVRRAGELGMHAYLYDEGGWPSGGACGRVVASDPEGRFTPREIVRGKDGGLSVAKRTFPKGRAAFPSLIERGTTQRFLGLTHEAYAKWLGDALGSTVRIAFTDEPDMPYGTVGPRFAWTADFADEFSRRKGYDIMQHVPSLLADKSRTNSALAQVRIDVMDVKADMFVERYLAPVRDWCRAHGTMSGGHLNNEDDPERALDRSHGSLLRSLRAMDVPGVDVIWRQLFPADGDIPAKVNPFPRYAASAMRQNGGRFALSESFGIFGDSVSPAQMKWIVDYQMVRGINLFVFGYLAQSNAKHWMTLFEPHAGPATPYWDFQPHFFRYIERTSRFLSQGRPGTEIVVLLNTRAFWAGANEAEAAAKAHYAVAHELDAMNCDYDFAEDRDLASAEITSGGNLRIGAMEYKAVVLPSEEWMLAGAKEKVVKFAEAGGIVARGLDLGRVPRTLDVKGTGARALRVMKRIDGARRIWCVMNEDMDERLAEISFPRGGAVVRYDSERDAFESVSDNGMVRRKFRGGETAIYVTGDLPSAAAAMRYEGRKMTIDSGWTLRALVSHVAGTTDFEVRQCVGEARPVALGDWRRVLGETFSGKAVYRVEFDSDIEGNALLDLGEVKWCASARLNGVDLGARFFGPFRWPVSLKKGRNALEVTVANLLANQVGDDATRDRILNEFKPNGQYDNYQRPFDKLNHESGLFGPVTVLESNGEKR